jgi:hypothetical protein
LHHLPALLPHPEGQALAQSEWNALTWYRYGVFTLTTNNIRRDIRKESRRFYIRFVSSITKEKLKN